MCGRYYMDIDEKEFIKIIEEAEKNIYGDCKTGEIFPSDIAPIYIKNDKGMLPIFAKWGFPKWDGMGLIINARAETLTGKLMFKNLVNTSRCIVPASYYFEWKKDDTDKNNKEKYSIKAPDSPIYMAGLYNIVPRHDSKQLSLFNTNGMVDIYYTIITKEASNSVSHIHNRMPLIFDKSEMNDWLNGKNIMESVEKNNHMLISEFLN